MKEVASPPSTEYIMIMPKNIKVLAEKLGSNELAGNLIKPPYDYNALIRRYEAFQNGGQYLNLRDRRKLAWAINLGDPPLYRRNGIWNLLKVIQDGYRTTSILGVIGCYLSINKSEERIVNENLNTLSQWIISNLNEYRGNHPKILHWRRHIGLFTSNGREAIANAMSNVNSTGFAQTIKNIATPLHSHAIADILLRLSFKIAQNYKNVNIMKNFLNFLETDFQRKTDTTLKECFPLETKQMCLDRILKTAYNYYLNYPNQDLIDYCLRVFGDPRTDYKNRWVNMSKEAREVISRWISEEDLRRFFSEISCDERRHNFWKEFVKIGRINYSKIIVGDENYNYGSKELAAMVKSGRYARLSGKRDLNAFILGIDNYLIVEFSQVGNAVFVYSTNSLGENFLRKKTYSTYDLKKPDIALKRLIHSGNWEYSFAFDLKHNFSIQHPKFQ